MNGLRRIIALGARRQAATGLVAAGCTEDEVRRLEEAVGCPLPAIYRHLLLCDGHGGLRLLEGTDWTFPTLIQVQTWARDMAARDGFEYDDNYLTIAMHQGYQFFFVDVREGGDPPLMHYMEKAARSSQFSATLSAGLAELVAAEIDLHPGAF